MNDAWNIFEHSEEMILPEKNTSWTRTALLDSEEIHIWPIDDEQEHIFATSCLCTPDSQTKNDERIVIHKAWDGRAEYTDFGSDFSGGMNIHTKRYGSESR